MAAGFLGWTLDSFDFFTVVFLIAPLSLQWHVSKALIVLSITLTLAMRPLGALLFGWLSDRYGRRRPLIANVLFFSVMELACGFAPNFHVFLLLRALFGLGMGGEWGIGAALTLETASRGRRGVLSGLLQSGYSMGYLLAALAAHFALPVYGWRVMFWLGGVPALLALYVRWSVPESRAWQTHRPASSRALFAELVRHRRLLLYLLLLMTLMMFLSHGTQDLYPDFLTTARHLPPALASNLAIAYNLAAIAGAVFFGWLSNSTGRRYAMLAALALALAAIPAWAFAHTLLFLVLGAILMQTGVQGAWGIIPAHLTELSPPAARSLAPGLMYQLGILIAAPTSTLEYWLRDHFGYSRALAGFELVNICLLGLVIFAGSERTGYEFMAPAATAKGQTKRDEPVLMPEQPPGVQD